jgi:uncharacterized protein (TIGR00730 family)
MTEPRTTPPAETRAPEEHTETFNAWDPSITRQIDELVKLAGVPGQIPDNSDLVREIIVTALKTQHSRLDRGDVKILSRSLRELRYGFRIFKNYRDRRKVTIFGSARTAPRDPSYKQTKRFAQIMVKNGFMIITGAGPGIMQAGNEGAGKSNSFGVNIRLPYEQKPNEFIADESLFIDCRFFFTRKLMFVKETSAVAFFPGGFGTHDEAMEVLTLVQTGKSDPMPIVFLDAPRKTYWRDWRAYLVKHLLKGKKISPEDLGLFMITTSPEEAAEEIVTFYKNYHSIRYVKDKLVMRLRKPPSSAVLAHLNKGFKDICEEGGFEASGALPEESGEHPGLPRLVFQFNRLAFGRLRGLIDYLNAKG